MEEKIPGLGTYKKKKKKKKKKKTSRERAESNAAGPGSRKLGREREREDLGLGLGLWLWSDTMQNGTGVLPDSIPRAGTERKVSPGPFRFHRSGMELGL